LPPERRRTIRRDVVDARQVHRHASEVQAVGDAAAAHVPRRHAELAGGRAPHASGDPVGQDATRSDCWNSVKLYGSCSRRTTLICRPLRSASPT
jgi:hypothetical protein